MRNYREYIYIKKALKQEAKKRLSDDLQRVKTLSKNDIIASWYFRECLTKKQQEKPEKELKSILIDKLKKRSEKQLTEKMTKCDAICKSENINYIRACVDWSKNRVWGFNPHAEVFAGGLKTCGSAGGCGYDKLSSALAEAFNQNNSILKLLYDRKEKALRSKNDKSNHDTIGYGSGYGVFPYFEGGVGVSSFRNIFQKMGASVVWQEGKTWDFFEVVFK